MADTLITYKIVSDDAQGRLKAAAKTSCNFWNLHVRPAQSIVMRLGLFSEQSETIAQAYVPYKVGNVVYGVVEFNDKYLGEFDDNDVAGTVVHELGHTLGYGWEKWNALFDQKSGKPTPDAVKRLRSLRGMTIELDYGEGTELCHWDEEVFGAELMTGIHSGAEVVKPVTIDVLGLLGHTVTRRLTRTTSLASLLKKAKAVQFLRLSAATALDREAFVQTSVVERIPRKS